MASKKDPKEFTIPMALISLSVLIYGASGFSEEGAEGAMGVIVVIGLYMIFGVISGIAGFYIASGLFGMAYGNLLTAIPKMAAVVLFPGSIASFMPTWPGLITNLILYCFLLSWLYDLDAREAIITALTLFILRVLSICAIISMLV